jgi:hypothetical protein
MPRQSLSPIEGTLDDVVHLVGVGVVWSWLFVIGLGRYGGFAAVCGQIASDIVRIVGFVTEEAGVWRRTPRASQIREPGHPSVSRLRADRIGRRAHRFSNWPAARALNRLAARQKCASAQALAETVQDTAYDSTISDDHGSNGSTAAH